MIKYYSTEAEYLAAAKPNTESHVSFIGENNEPKFDGSNIVIGLDNAMTGDAVVLDINNALRIIPRATYVNAALPEGFTKVGVVVMGIDHEDFRGEVAILRGEAAAQSKVWSYIYSFKLAGYTLDGTDRSGVLSIRTAANWNTAVDFTVNYNASDIDSLVGQLNTFFRDTTNEVFQTQDWIAVKSGDEIHLQFHFTAYQQASNTGKTGFTLTANLLPEIAASSNMLRLNGQRSGEGSILNMPRALAYFKSDLAAGTYNPTTVQTAAQAKRSYPICLPGYLGTSANVDGDKCAAIRAIYGEGEAGWLKFMESFYPVRPTTYGPMGDFATYGDGKINTYKLAGRTWTGQSGTAVVAFPAADYCANAAMNHELLKKGCWFMPDINLLTSIIKGIKYNTTNDRNADVVNQTLYAMGFAALSNGANAWSSSRYLAYYAWCFIGASGYAYGSYHSLTLAFRALPVVLLKIK